MSFPFLAAILLGAPCFISGLSFPSRKSSEVFAEGFHFSMAALVTYFSINLGLGDGQSYYQVRLIRCVRPTSLPNPNVYMLRFSGGLYFFFFLLFLIEIYSKISTV